MSSIPPLASMSKMKDTHISEQEESEEIDEGVWKFLVLLESDPNLPQ